MSKEHAEILLFIEVLEQDYLHPKIREQGGAYGARATYREVGTVALYSYMDPYAKETFQAFDEGLNEIIANPVEAQRLEETKIKLIGEMDAPKVPQSRCLAQILKDLTNEDRNAFRQFIKDANWEQVKKTGVKYLHNVPKSRVIFGKDVPEGFKEEKLRIPKNK